MGAEMAKQDADYKSVICSSCDISCTVTAKVVDGQVVKIQSSDNPLFRDQICMKAIYAPKGFAHPDRLMYPLKRVGERGSGQFERISWEQAIDEICEKLRGVVDQYGPEALAVSTSDWNGSTENGLSRRFMNLLGTPNYISGVALCAGNTAAVNRLVYGWYPFADIERAECILLMGHNPRRHSWVPIYNMIRKAQARGAKLIVWDPRKSESAERADLWLPLKPGTDAAMLFGWLKVILDEGLYDKEFARKWTVGFEAFKARVDEFPLSRVAQITGVDEELIARSARMYANHVSCIPWSPITDQQRNSTSAIRLICALRALCGNIDVPGGEPLQGFNPDIPELSHYEMHDVLSDEQKAKQLGSDKHPVFTYRAMGRLEEATEKVWGFRYANLVKGSYMAVPSSVFRAMAHGDPYPVKAFIFQGNNPLLSYANMKLIYQGMMNQDLIVAHEQFMTPSAQLADYVLPSDAWTERNSLFDGFAWLAVTKASQKAMEPPGECRSSFDFWTDLAHGMGLGNHFPWRTNEEMLSERVQKLAPSFDAFAEEYDVHVPHMAYKKYEKTGFATPSGKVELYSELLEEFGFDPLPYWREDPPADPGFNLTLFTGVREDEFFQTGHRHIPELRARKPEPQAYLNPKTAQAEGLAEGDWVEVATKEGACKLTITLHDTMPEGLVRVPHGWWKPEMAQGVNAGLSGAWDFADAQICPDDDDYLDAEQGIPHLKGLPCKLTRLGAMEAAE